MKKNGKQLECIEWFHKKRQHFLRKEIQRKSNGSKKKQNKGNNDCD